MNSTTAILSTAYLPPIQYFAKILDYSEILIEAHETYLKQSYRNRCIILSCNGPLPLIIPVVKTNGNNTPIKEIEIDYTVNWQKNHWKAIESAYRTSVYYDFVSDLLEPFYRKKVKYLFDFNSEILFEIISFLRVNKPLSNSNQFVKNYLEGFDDFRQSIHPKLQYQLKDNDFVAAKYFQVFSDRFNFYPNLSIVDILFNEGLDSLSIIEESIMKNLP